MSRKTKKQKEQDEVLEELSLLYWVLSDEKRTKAVCDEIKDVGNMMNSMMLALQGKEIIDGAD